MGTDRVSGDLRSDLWVSLLYFSRNLEQFRSLLKFRLKTKVSQNRSRPHRVLHLIRAGAAKEQGYRAVYGQSPIPKKYHYIGSCRSSDQTRSSSQSCPLQRFRSMP